MIPSQENRHLCPYCLKRGMKNFIQPVQSSWKSAILLCSDPQCIFPLDRTLAVVDSDWNKKANGESSVDENIFDAAIDQLKNPRVLPSSEITDVGSPQKCSDQHADKNIADDSSPQDVKFGEMNGKMIDESIDQMLNEEDDDTEFMNFLEYLSNLPNTPFSSFLELPEARTIEIIKRQKEIMKVVSLPVIVIGDSPYLSRLSVVMDQRDGLASLESFNNRRRTADGGISLSVDESEPRRYAQWSEESDVHKCWLTSGISLIVHSRVIRNVLKAVSQAINKSNTKSAASPGSIIGTVCSSYEIAMQKLLVALTLRSDNTGNSSSRSSDSGSGFESLQKDFDYLTFGDQYGVSIPSPLHRRVVDHLESCQKIVSESMEANKVLASHPADVLAFLLDSDENLRELSIVSYRCTFSCSVCNHSSVKDYVSRAVTLEIAESVAKFSLSGPDCCISIVCEQCGADNQVGHLTWLTFSPLLVLHFPSGLPDGCEFENFSINSDAMNISKENIAGYERYCITSKGQYQIRVSGVVISQDNSTTCSGPHYLTWVRRGETWMACQEALGEGSHLAEWDPLTAPKTIGQSGRNVRVILLEALPDSRNRVSTPSEPGKSVGEIRLKSRLQQRVINIMRERRKVMRQQHSNSVPSAVTPIPPTDIPDPATTIMQRFLHSEVEHKSLLGGTSSRFQPYPADTRHSGSAAEASMRPANRADPSPLMKFVSRLSMPEADVRPREWKAVSQAKCSSAVRGQVAKPYSYSDISAASLWPTRALSSAPASMRPSQRSSAPDLTRLEAPLSSGRSAGGRRSRQQNVRASASTSSEVPETASQTGAPTELHTFDLNSTTSFLDGLQSSLGSGV